MCCVVIIKQVNNADNKSIMNYFEVDKVDTHYRDGPVIATALFLTLQVLQSLQFMKNDFLFRDFYYILF